MAKVGRKMWREGVVLSLYLDAFCISNQIIGNYVIFNSTPRMTYINLDVWDVLARASPGGFLGLICALWFRKYPGRCLGGSATSSLYQRPGIATWPNEKTAEITKWQSVELHTA